MPNFNEQKHKRRTYAVLILILFLLNPVMPGGDPRAIAGSSLSVDGDESYTSTDYTHDGEVLTLQTTTVGQGIDFVILGEGFLDRDLEPGGKYERRARLAMEQFFAYEPFTSLRNRFNVYAVKVVSPEANFRPRSVHALNEDCDLCFRYAAKAPLLHPERPQVMVLYNKAETYGYSYCRSWFGETARNGSFCCFIKNPRRPTAINHEAGGHGYGFLFDEYVDKSTPSCLQPTDRQIEWLKTSQQYEVGENIAYADARGEVSWQRFLTDPRYSDEDLGLYEGAYHCTHGLYRATRNSMMRHSDAPFNAPSRESIYKHLMRYSEGAAVEV